VKSFPGWDSFSALITHLKFIKGIIKRCLVSLWQRILQ
jgi:hypothetical protein